MPKNALLERLCLRDTGIHDEANEAPFSCADLPTDWTILWSNDVEWADEGKGRLIAQETAALTCQLHEGVMWSSAVGYDNEGRRWSVTHDSDAGIDHLVDSGTLPDAYGAIKRQALDAQGAAGGAYADVDHVFDVPIMLSHALTDWRHDHWKFDWGLPHFTVVEPIS